MPGCNDCGADPSEFSASLDRLQRAALIVSCINKDILTSPHIHMFCFCLVFPKPLRLAVIPSVVYKLTVFSSPTLHYAENEINLPDLGRAGPADLPIRPPWHVSGCGWMRGKSEKEGSFKGLPCPRGTGSTVRRHVYILHVASAGGGHVNFVHSGGLLTVAKSVGWGQLTWEDPEEHFEWKTLHPRVLAGTSSPQTLLLWGDSANHRTTVPPLLLKKCLQ